MTKRHHFYDDDPVSDRVGPLWKYDEAEIVDNTRKEGRRFGTQEIPAVLDDLFSKEWFETQHQCLRCKSVYRERSNFGHHCVYHPSVIDSTGVYPCCGLYDTAAGRGCVRCDHSHYSRQWSTIPENSNFVFAAIPLCLLTALDTRPPRILKTISSFEQDECGYPAELRIEQPHFTRDPLSKGRGTFALDIPVIDVPSCRRINECLRYEATQRDYYTEVKRQFIPYVIVSRVGVPMSALRSAFSSSSSSCPCSSSTSRQQPQ